MDPNWSSSMQTIQYTGFFLIVILDFRKQDSSPMFTKKAHSGPQKRAHTEVWRLNFRSEFSKKKIKRKMKN